MHTLAVGFYSAQGLAQAIVSATFVSSGVTVTYLSNEGKFLFTRPVASGVFQLNIVTNELAALMGFYFPTPFPITALNANLDPNLQNNLVYQNKYYIKSQFVVEMNVNNSVFLDIQELRTIYNNCTPQGNPLDTTNNNTANRSFGLIPMDVCSGSIKHLRNTMYFNRECEYPYLIMKFDKCYVTRYMSAKYKLLDFILPPVTNLLREGESFVDLMAGTHSVGYALKKRNRIIGK